MHNALKILLVAGARPNFMKIAPLIGAIQAHNRTASPPAAPITHRLIHTGQHYDINMSEVFFRELNIPEPDINLGVGSGSHAEQTANVMIAFENVVQESRPDWVVVVGDVNSTLACTLVCSKLGIKVAHVEAGLRSFDRTMPEEINRVITDALADLLLTPSPDADDNLRREGIADEKIACVGNIMIDSLVSNLDKARGSTVLKETSVQPGGYVYVTLHRPFNVDDADCLVPIMENLRRLGKHLPVVFPMHPRTRGRCKQHGIELNGHHGLKVLDPTGYHDSLCLTENARLVITDSGGLQEESTYFRTPCLTLRPNTERPVTVTKGSNRLTAVERLQEDIEGVLQKPDRLGDIPRLWDGKTAQRILQLITSYPGQSPASRQAC